MPNLVYIAALLNSSRRAIHNSSTWRVACRLSVAPTPGRPHCLMTVGRPRHFRRHRHRHRRFRAWNSCLPDVTLSLFLLPSIAFSPLVPNSSLHPAPPRSLTIAFALLYTFVDLCLFFLRSLALLLYHAVLSDGSLLSPFFVQSCSGFCFCFRFFAFSISHDLTGSASDSIPWKSTI